MHRFIHEAEDLVVFSTLTNKMSKNQTALEGQVYVCRACGKRARDKYGFDPIDRGWDASCVLHSALVYENKLIIKDGRVVRVEEGGMVEEV